jgi:hypothetical protein
MIWKEVVMASFKVPPSIFLEGWRKIAGLWAEIWTQDLPNMMQECCLSAAMFSNFKCTCKGESNESGPMLFFGEPWPLFRSNRHCYTVRALSHCLRSLLIAPPRKTAVVGIGYPPLPPGSHRLMKNVHPSSFSALQTHGNHMATNLDYREGAPGPPIQILLVAMSHPLCAAKQCHGEDHSLRQETWQTINADHYHAILDWLHKVIKNRRPGLLTKGAILSHDNVQLHTAGMTLQ